LPIASPGSDGATLAPVVDREHGAVGLEQHHHLERRFEDRRGTALAAASSRSAPRPGAELELGFLGERDVGRDPDEADSSPSGPEAAAATRCAASDIRRRAACSALEREALARRLAGDALGDDPVDIVGMDSRRQSSVRASSLGSRRTNSA
jgi:hypothetical protein